MRDERTLWRSTPSGGVVLLGATDDAPRLITGSGAELWHQLASPRTLEELSRRAVAQADVDVEDVRAAIEDVISDLHAAGAVRRRS